MDFDLKMVLVGTVLHTPFTVVHVFGCLVEFATTETDVGVEVVVSSVE